MSIHSRKNRNAFRPTLETDRLEERVVLSSVSPLRAQTAGHVSVFQTNGPVISQQAGFGNLSVSQVRTTYLQQLQADRVALRQAIDNQIATLYGDPANLGPNGRPTAQALANFQANVNGAIDATALRLSGRAALLPGSNSLISGMQSGLLGSQRNGLSSRIASVVNFGNGHFTRSASALQFGVNNQIQRTFNGFTTQMNRFFRTTPLTRLAIDPTTGQPVSLSQFMSRQAINQINNTFGALANSVGPNARTGLFNSSGVFNPQGVPGFQQQFGNALGTAAFQVGNILSVFPNAQTTLGPQLQSAFFGTGTNPTTGLPNTSFLNALTSTLPNGTGTGTSPFTLNRFNTGFQSGFTNAFQNFTTPLNSFFGTTPTTGGGFQLPNGFFQTGATFPSLFGSQFNGSTFNSGFNNGFLTTGTGFPGFGTTPTGFNTSFGTGFNSFTGALNQQFGFTQPTFGTGTPLATGGIGTTLGAIGTGTPLATGGIGTTLGAIGTGTPLATGGIGTTLGTMGTTGAPLSTGGIGTSLGMGGIGTNFGTIL